MNIFLENLAAEWEHAPGLAKDEVSDYAVDTQLFLASALQIARLTQLEE